MEFVTLDSVSLLLAATFIGKIGNALSVVLGLGMVIFFHELGHFAVAKWCDVHVERFSIGIGPIIWSRQKGETEYALSALPFGGYVKMLGQDDMDPNQMTSDEIAENPRSYSAKKVWQRMAIITAGVTMNVITGFMFFAIAYRSGVVELTPIVGQVIPGMPAWEAGLNSGDHITKINGTKIHNFEDINQNIILSSGPVNILGTHADGEAFDVKIAPRQGKTVRAIGVVPADSSTLSPQIPAEEADSIIVMSGLASENASQKFKPGDRIVSVNGAPVKYLHEMSYWTAKFAAEEITYAIERPLPAKDGAKDQPEEFEKLDITIPPKPMKSIGLWMTIGPVTSVREGSIAQKAGLKLDDQITMVDELVVSKDIDPLRLPNYFADHADTEVTVTVKRQSGSEGLEEVQLVMTPSDAPGWSQRPTSITAPLPIPAIGAGFHVNNFIAHIVPGSEASKVEKLEVNQRVAKVFLQHPNPEKIVKDLLGDKAAPEEVDFENFETDEKTPGRPNWAFVFNMIQQVPKREIRLQVKGAADGTDEFAFELKTNESVDDWFMPVRGLNGWERDVMVRRAESWGEASSLALRHTKTSGINIYMTLRSLFAGDLNVRALSGPLGIVSIGYQVADHGITKLLMFLGFLSINLAVLNFLPIPVLDGGHMVFLIWEAVARKKPSPKVINIAHGIGLIFIISLFVFVLYLDLFVNRLGFGG